MNENRFALLSLGGLGVFALAASLAPLAAYTLALAGFGLPHVLAELRYLDRRFGAGFSRRLLLTAGAPLGVIVVERALVVGHLLPPERGAALELGCAALLALGCARGSGLRRSVALLAGAAIGVAGLAAPFATMVVFSVLHNFAPLGFLWQISPRERRPRAMALAAIAFGALPLAVALGLPRLALGDGAALDPLGAGPLAAHLSVYVPEPLLDGAPARDLFAAAVTAQGAHYLAVLIVLPALLARRDAHAAGLLRWPRHGGFACLCALCGGLAFLAFARDFPGARALYGVAAAFHAWIEIPILVTALTSKAPPDSASPSAKDAALAARETSIA